MRLCTALLGTALLVLAIAAGAEPVYDVSYEARIVPSKRSVQVTLRVGQQDGELKELLFQIDPERHRDFEGDGDVAVQDRSLEWKPPPVGGKLRYSFRVDQLRDDQSYDARCGTQWALFRGDDLVPPARATTKPGARARSRLRLRVPEGWSLVTRYPPSTDGWIALQEQARRFVRPTGWILAGEGLGVVRERVAGTRVTIAGPSGQGLRRLDILALLRWTLPELNEILGAAPERLLVVGAGDPMWRGGLSGPQSLFIHAGRPLITSDTTSPLLHEVLHAVLRMQAVPGDDWILEGLAERYALELLVRSKTISRNRHERALARLKDKGRAAAGLRSAAAAGAVTDRAVTVLEALDREIRAASQGARSLDDALRTLLRQPGKLSTARLRSAAEAAAGRDLAAFFQRQRL